MLKIINILKWWKKIAILQTARIVFCYLFCICIDISYQYKNNIRIFIWNQIHIYDKKYKNDKLLPQFGYIKNSWRLLKRCNTIPNLFVYSLSSMKSNILIEPIICNSHPQITISDSLIGFPNGLCQIMVFQICRECIQKRFVYECI